MPNTTWGREQRDTALTEGGETARVRRRIQLLVEITSKDGEFRKGLDTAAQSLSPQEAIIIADLERHGLQVPQLRDVLYGGHVIVDDPALYDSWKFDDVSHLRISSHHRTVDKEKYPDIGMRGTLVREKLHGRTAQGTWVQLEKTPAAMGAKKLPSMDDVRHLFDYVVYRITKKNVGPWGLSGRTESRPMYLSPDIDTQVALSEPVAAALNGVLAHIESTDDTTSASSDLAAHFPAPALADPRTEMGIAGEQRCARGLFGNSEVWVTEAASEAAAPLLSARVSATDGPDIWTEGVIE